MDLDLFGEPIKYEHSTKLIYLQDKDEFTLGNRLKRLEYLHQLNPDGISILGNDMELMFSYRELQEVFINGHFLSTIVLGQAWMEKLLHIELINNNLNHIAKKGFYHMIKYSKEHKLLHSYLIEKMDKFRLIRNPITHLKENNYKHNLNNRSFSNMENPLNQLENDAREIIAVCGHIAKYGLNK